MCSGPNSETDKLRNQEKRELRCRTHTTYQRQSQQGRVTKLFTIEEANELIVVPRRCLFRVYEIDPKSKDVVLKKTKVSWKKFP